MDDEFPEAVARRRLLVFVEEGQRDSLRASREGQKLLREASVRVFEVPISSELTGSSGVLERSQLDGAVEPGAVLVVHPHNPDRYLPLDLLSTETAQSKIRITTHLAAHLG